MGEQVPLVRSKLAGDDPHWHVDVVRAGAAGKPIELIRNVVGILSSQRWSGLNRRDGTMAGLARRYAAVRPLEQPGALPYLSESDRAQPEESCDCLAGSGKVGSIE